jgi:hypothetical protein
MSSAKKIRQSGEEESMDNHLTSHEKAAIIEKAERWASRLYKTAASGFLNWSLSDPQAKRYVVDIALDGIEQWIRIEIHIRHGAIVIPGGALITGRGSLTDIHRRFS